MKTKKEIFDWIVKVIISCNNYAQLTNASKLIKLYRQKNKENSDVLIDYEGLENCFFYQCNKLKIQYDERNIQ